MHRDELTEDSLRSWQFPTSVVDAIYAAWLHSLASKLDTSISLQQIHSSIHSFIHMASVACSLRVQINTIGKQDTNHSHFFIS